MWYFEHLEVAFIVYKVGYVKPELNQLGPMFNEVE